MLTFDMNRISKLAGSFPSAAATVILSSALAIEDGNDPLHSATNVHDGWRDQKAVPEDLMLQLAHDVGWGDPRVVVNADEGITIALLTIGARSGIVIQGGDFQMTGFSIAGDPMSWSRDIQAEAA